MKQGDIEVLYEIDMDVPTAVYMSRKRIVLEWRNPSDLQYWPKVLQMIFFLQNVSNITIGHAFSDEMYRVEFKTLLNDKLWRRHFGIF